MRTVSTICIAVASALLPATAAAQNCNGNLDLSGTYEFTVSRLVWTPVAFGPPGTTTVTLLSPAELAVKRAGQQGSFASQGRVTSDGAGTIFVNSSGGATVRAGTYSVSSDCALTMSLDGPEAESTGEGATNTQRARATFRGFLWNRGEEAVLMQSGGPGGQGAQMRLSRPYRFTGCSNSSLSGLYGLSAMGIREETPPTGGSGGTGSGGTASSGPGVFSLLGQMLADGNGNFITPASGGQGLLTGTYSVNSDCTGSGMIENGDQKFDFRFVLVEDRSTVQSSRPALRVTFQADRIAATGIAR